jgi:hypothetical protein
VKTLYINLILAFVGLTAFAEDSTHPRVAELEQSLANQAHNYLSSRFPGMPFLVNVKVDPMFRNERNANGAKGEQLPYFDLSSEEIVDEWDDPSKPLNQLQRRVRKTVVTISVPNQLPESEAVEIRESTVSFLNLNAARDEVYINRKAWRTYNVQWLEVLLIGTGILFFLMGMLWINRISSNKIAKALEESARKSGSASGGVSLPTSSAGNETKSSKGGGEFQMHDPVKLKDLAVRTIDTLCAAKGFPSHLDVFELNEVGRKDPAALGAILVEFPQAVQDKLFAYSKEDWWMQALNEPGAMDFETLMVLRKLLRNRHVEEESAWSALLLSTWRLSPSERIEFLQKVSKEEAIAVLKALPKGIALNTARKLFPGGWAQVLEASSSKEVSIDAKRCEKLCTIAQSVQPLRTRGMLDQYREELELLNHLNASDPYEEREIYQVLSEESRIVQNRPPFFVLFDQDEETCRAVFSAFSVGLWAKVLADMKPAERGKIEGFLSEKQRFLYNDLVRQVNPQNQAEREEIGRIRFQIASYLHNLIQKKVEKEREPDILNEPLREAA